VEQIVYLTIEQSATRVQRSGRTISAAIASGTLKAKRDGRRTRISLDELRKWAHAEGLSVEDAETAQELYERTLQALRGARLECTEEKEDN
jgi:excisionase family DNA binding protein